MKGIILAAGEGTRLHPLTKTISKQLLPVYNKPMFFYPLQTLIRAGIKDILIIVSPRHAGDFLHLLGSGKEFGVKLTYEIQDRPDGLAQAFIIGENFIGKDSVTMILGDNIFEDDFALAVRKFKKGGHIFAKEVPDPERFGVVKFARSSDWAPSRMTGRNLIATKIVEKPKKFLSNYAITGFYIFDNRVVEVAKKLKPSARGELEITDLHNWYLKRGELKVDLVKGEWIDAGTFDALLKAGNWVKKQIEKRKEI
ncbi:MAG: hypothetical protein G01um101444_282 [Parcubacteria group bacterium Gr01-1014_44]|nr:MAG: hypothetical protein G01um101444_282 [Parcubacteria group bacterium Gr01-1014_44]